jgi:hypothetical protein
LNKVNSKAITVGILFIIPVIGLLLSISLFVPAVREMIIDFGETHVVHRALTHPVWHERMIEWACAAFVFSLLLAMLVFAFVKDLVKAIETFFSRDLIGLIGCIWNDISPLYKKSFCVVFLGLNIVFALHTATFMIGNHDWGLLFSRSPLVGELAIGRYFYNVFSFIVLNGRFCRC